MVLVFATNPVNKEIKVLHKIPDEREGREK